MFEPKKREGDSFRDIIDELNSQSGSIDKTEAEPLVERLDKLIPKIRDEREKEDCLRVLAKVCREQVVLPKSYIVSDLKQGERLKSGVADIWTGKVGKTGILENMEKVLEKIGILKNAGRLGKRDICIKVFRQDENQQAFKGAVYCLAVRWKYVSHPNVLPFLGVSDIIPPFGLITSRMSSDIMEYTEERQDADRLLLLTNAACGLEYLHSRDIVHGRINPRNILITGRGTACIGDFGIAEIINNSLVASQSRAATRNQGGTRYMALEQVKNSVSVKESDVHSFAITALEVLVRIEPHRGVAGEGPLCMRIQSGAPPFLLGADPAVRGLSDDMRRMLESCWVPERSRRPTIEEVHRALRGPRSNGKKNGSQR